jgi:hypothetical protein
MSLSEMARTPFSLVDEINQVGLALDMADIRVWTKEPRGACTMHWSMSPVGLMRDSES